jgi:tetratricopeptide (TPR) repeat protein
MIETGLYRGEAQAVIYNNRGKALIEIGDNDRALQDLNEAIQLDQNLAVAFSNRGLAWLNLKKHDLARQDLDEALRLDPKLELAYKNRAVVLLAMKSYDSAIADFDKVIQLKGKPDPDDYVGRGTALLGKKDYDGALANFNEAIQNSSPPPASYFAFRSAAWIGKSYDRALQDVDDAIQLDPKLVVALNNRGFIYNNKGEFDRAISNLNEAIHLDPKSTAGYKNLGISYEKKGHADKALADFRTALSLDPHNQEAAAGLSRVTNALAAQSPKANVSETPPAVDNSAATDAGEKADTIPEADEEKAALVKVMKEAVSARHGGVLPKTMSAEHTNVAAQAAIKWKARQVAEKSKHVLEAMKTKPQPSSGYAEIVLAEEAIKRIMRDPDSTVFGDVFFVNDRKTATAYYVPVVCGTVNGRNGFGGMTGQMHFVAVLSDIARGLWLEGTTAQNVIAPEWNRFCAGQHD